MKYCILIALLFPFSVMADYYDDSLTPEQIQQLRTGANAGDAEAEYHLAMAYLKGDGVTEDDHEATHWLIKSAEQGNTDAQFSLGFVYRGGNGVPMDNVQSYMWFDIAANNGHEKAIELRKDISTSMTDDQIDEARALAKHWRSEHRN